MSIFTPDFILELDKITVKYDKREAALLPVLHRVQAKDGLITPEAEQDVADYIGIPVVKVHQVVCFYHLFHQEKKGKCHFSVCQTTACSLLGAEDIIEHLENRVGIKAGETTADGKFSITRVECLGACELAPMMQQNHEYVGHLNKKKIDEIIDSQR